MTKVEKKTRAVFFELLRAGLWADVESTDLRNHGFTEPVDWNNVYQLAGEQSVIGVVLAGIERMKNDNPNLYIPQELLLQWIGEVQMLEQQNRAMNKFIAELVEKLQKDDIYTLLVKGQGIAQCYERPLWRSCGDVDLFLSDSDYDKAKALLLPLASSVEPEGLYKKHFEMVIDPWVVELHGSMRSGLSSRIDSVIDDIQNDVFFGGDVRPWMNGVTQVLLPGINSDVIFVFTHYIKHFYCEGLGLRQICDWCRLLWIYRDTLNHGLLESRIRKMGLMSEWKAFAVFVVEYLGMPIEAMPFYDVRGKKDDVRWKKKAERIMEFILESGNFGHNRDNSYFQKYPFLIRKTISMGRRCGGLIQHAKIFPWDSLRFFPGIIFNGLRSAATGE